MTSVIDTQVGTDGNYEGTLREAINFANQNVPNPSSGATIVTQPGLAGPIALAGNLPLVANSIDLDGGGLTLNAGGQYRGFLISGIASDGMMRPHTVNIAGGAIFVGPAATRTADRSGVAERDIGEHHICEPMGFCTRT